MWLKWSALICQPSLVDTANRTAQLSTEYPADLVNQDNVANSVADKVDSEPLWRNYLDSFMHLVIAIDKVCIDGPCGFKAVAETIQGTIFLHRVVDISLDTLSKVRTLLSSWNLNFCTGKNMLQCFVIVPALEWWLFFVACLQQLQTIN